ncbi:MAG TPA: Sapep family Mn(2+)-dependent dipeptidase [Clostridia bacterium]|nr:Sapep family Mn(2+)-dependent dipeptidase [Clostridia bacterium]
MYLNKFVNVYREKLIEATQELIKIPSVKAEPKEGKPFGEEISNALEYVLEKGRELGFLAVDVDGYAGFIEFGQGSETLAILAHLDVVPEGDGWTHPPYGGEIHDNRIYGRGTIDNKGPALAALYAMKAVMESGVPVNKKVRLILGTDEESGWECMDYYFKKQPMPDFGITPDANYPVIHAEKGIIHIQLSKKFQSGDIDKSSVRSMKGGSRPNMVPDNCVSMLADKTTLSIDGVSAHGSTPDKGVNAISKTLEIMKDRGFGDNALDRFLGEINDLLGDDTKGQGLGIQLSDEVSGNLTLNLGVIDVDEKGGKAIIDIRFPVTYSQEEIMDRINNSLRGRGIESKILHSQKPLHVPKDHFLIKALSKVYEEQTGQTVDPVTIGGGTYARALDIGVAFGPVFPGKPELAHQKDEYIDIDDLVLNTQIYAHTIAELIK